MELIEKSGPYVMWAALIIFNLAIVRLLQWGLKNISISDALREKDPSAARAAVANAPLKDQPVGDGTTPAGPDATSYSRLSGFVGAIVLASFLWGLGNVILYKAFAENGPEEIQSLLSSIGSFFLAGAALFAPYAFNQLKGVFQTK